MLTLHLQCGHCLSSGWLYRHILLHRPHRERWVRSMALMCSFSNHSVAFCRSFASFSAFSLSFPSDLA